MIVANDLCKQFERTVLEEENGKKRKKIRCREHQIMPRTPDDSCYILI